MLIREARRRQRRRWVAASVALLVAIVVTMVVVSSGGAHTGKGSPSVFVDGQPSLTGDRASGRLLGPGSSIWSVDMLTASHGFGVAGSPSGRLDEYLVETTDGGTAWYVRGLLPYTYRHWSTQPAVHFVNASLGYTQIPSVTFTYGKPEPRDPKGFTPIPETNFSVGPLFETTDGGHTWRQVQLRGQEYSDQSDMGLWPSYGDYQFSGGVLTVVSDECNSDEFNLSGGSECASSIAQYLPGAVRPYAVHPIPKAFTDATMPSSASLVNVVSASTAIVQERSNGPDLLTKDLITTDGGAQWRAFGLPCGSSQAGELLVVPGHRWIQECTSLINGYDGSVHLFATHDGGGQWKSIKAASAIYGPRGYYTPKKEQLAGASYELWSNRTGTVLWGVDVSTPNQRGLGMVMSTNGGRTWVPCYVVGPLFAGGPGEGAFSANGNRAVLVLPTGAAYRTANGIKWTRVRLLTAL
jgi:hypothetical protein